MPIPSLKKRKYFSNRRWQSRHIRYVGWKKTLLVRFLITGLLSFLVLITGILAWVSRDLPTAEGIARRTIPLSTKIYDRTGQHLLYNIHGEEKRTAVELKDIPDYLKYATITAEDRNFYKHKGFRLTSMVRAILVNLLRGGKVQGGSTITQQFIKNAIFTNEKLYTRKIKELILAYQIEKKFSKDEILKLYFNEIPYGSNAYGAEAAAQTFFGKSVGELTLAESAILASLPKGTTYYSPYGSRVDELIARQHYILDAMVDEGYISREEAETAKKQELKFRERRDSITAPHFVFYIREQLAAKYGDWLVEQGGLKIITSLDINKQKIAEEAISRQSEKNQAFGASNASLVAIDVANNEVLAMVGSKNYFDDSIAGQVNVAVRPRQPGSSFKPFVYAAAFELGFTPETIVFDVNTSFKTDTRDYEPKNYNLKEHGPISLKSALAGSLNIPAVKLLYLTGIDRVLDLAKKIGYSTLNDRSRFGLSLVLGGAEVKLLEHTSAYAALAREGVTKPIVSILKVEDARGNILEEIKENRGEKILTTQAAREVTNILADNEARSYIFGTQNYLTLPDRPAAVKTGTTNDYRDAWTLGYTPQLATGVWVGNSNNKEMKRGADGSVLAAPIWQYFMSRVLSGQPIQQFVSPEPRFVEKPMLNGKIGGEIVIIDRATGLRATDLTPESFREEKLFTQYHTILKYVTPGDPLGPLPQNPESDPQYERWESAVRRWVTENNLSDSIPPIDYDYLHTEANRPQISFVSPSPNQTITQNPFLIQVNVSAPRGVSRVVYFIDNQEIGVVKQAPWSLNFTFSSEWTNGFHVLTAIAYDDIDNSNKISINFNLLVKTITDISGLKFYNLNNFQTIAYSNLPYNVLYGFTEQDQVKQVDFYLSPSGQPSVWLGVATAFEKENIITIPLLSPGNYTISTIITNKQNLVLSGPKINFVVKNQ